MHWTLKVQRVSTHHSLLLPHGKHWVLTLLEYQYKWWDPNRMGWGNTHYCTLFVHCCSNLFICTIVIYRCSVSVCLLKNFSGSIPIGLQDWSHLHSSYFSYVLNFLRTSELTLPRDFKETELLRKEADFYQIEPLIQCLGEPRPLLPYPTDTYEEVVELSSTRKLSKYSNPVAVIITQLTVTTKVSGMRSDWGCFVRLCAIFSVLFIIIIMD